VADGATVFWNKLNGRPGFAFERRRDFYLAWKEYGWIHTKALIGEMKARLVGNVKFDIPRPVAYRRCRLPPDPWLTHPGVTSLGIWLCRAVVSTGEGVPFPTLGDWLSMTIYRLSLLASLVPTCPPLDPWCARSSPKTAEEEVRS